MSLSTNLVAPRIKRDISAEIVPLGWNHSLADDLAVIQADVSRYVAVAREQGFSYQDMLQDVQDKYNRFFMSCGECDAIERDGSTVVVFYLRARKGR